ncbi:unnamed protein product [Phytophthora fragariaefolia]|uniref:Unnamed protein product n=1 Tax=Phytophthora fragariaefolia TaxID=1490495 RepID=A0A9W6YGK7_9STRA|nr:unnamed protein product [Phytophthora fragariaefolia]
MTKNPVNHGRAKHIDIKYHHIRDEVKRGEVLVEYCEIATMLADIMTKGLAGPRHKELTTALAIHACSLKKVVLGSCTWKLVLDTAEAWSESREGT